MSSARYALTPARRIRRSVVVAVIAASGAVLPAVLPGSAAAADEPASTTVVGELLQTWVEPAPAHMAASHAESDHAGSDHPASDHAESGHAASDHAEDGLLSWVDPAQGEPVLVDSAGVAAVPVGSTVALSVGDVEGSTGGDDVHGTPRTVLAAELIAPAAAPPAPRTAGPVTNEVTVAMVAPAGSPPAGDGTTLDQVAGVVDGPVADFWAEETNGAISVGVTGRHDWLAAAADCSNPGALWDEVAARVGFVPGPGRHLLLYVSRQSACSYALAEVGTGPTSGGRLYTRDATASVIAHELGHNFGLGHSSGEQCDQVLEGGSCRTVPYRDHYDVMGVSWAQLGSLNAAQAARLGVLPPAQQRRLTVGQPATTTTLAPVSGRVGTRAVQLTDSDGVGYWLEYRTATARDRWLAGSANRYRLDQGVLLRRAGALPDSSLLLDGTPSTSAGWSRDLQAALPLGVAVPVSGEDFTVVVQSVSPEGAVLSITPAPSATPGTRVTTPAAVVPGGVLSATAATVEAGGAAEPAPSVPSSASPAGAPAEAAPVAAPVPVDVPALRGARSLASVAGTPSSGESLLPLAGGLLAGSVLLASSVLLAVRLRRRGGC